MIIILVVALAIIAYLAIAGTLNPAYFQKSAYIAGTAAAFDTPLVGNPQIMSFLPRAGDPFYFTGQTRGINGANVTLKLVSPDGQNLYPNTSLLSGSLYGKTLYIYPKISASATQCDYAISDTIPMSTFRPMVIGCWTLQTIDARGPVLIDSYKVKITQGRESLPAACGYIAAPGEKFYRSDCTALDQTQNGPPIQRCVGASPGNMACSNFTGTSYVSLPNDPTLSFTGQNLALSMWIKPSRAVTSVSDTTNWYTLIGKGQLNLDGSEYDNYQMTQIGDEIYFEWTDPTTTPATHYHIITTSSPILARTWTQVTVTIKNGQLRLFTNCVEQPIDYYRGNYPTDTRTSANYLASPVTVNLAVTSNNFLVGKQNAANPANSFYFNGEMAGVSVYNRGLSGSEIANACTGNYVC
jgi:hypothetical protein